MRQSACLVINLIKVDNFVALFTELHAGGSDRLYDDPDLKLFIFRVRGLSCEPNNQLNFCTTSETEGDVVHVKLV